jgi:MerR family transcriptional regulator, mercuric resistance operon regulatory protein
MSNRNQGFTIGVVSKRSGVKIETIRYYEQEGLLPEPPRSEGGHRQYDERHLRRLAFVRRSRELGFSVEQIRSLLALVDDKTQTCAQVKDLTVEHLRDVRKKLADLKTIERVLNKMASHCEGGLVPDCPIIDALYEARSD